MSSNNALISFDRPWENVYLPLCMNLAKSGVIRKDWTKEMSIFLQTRSLLFKNNSFVICEKSSSADPVPTFYAAVALAEACSENYDRMKAINMLLVRPLSRLVPEEARKAQWPLQLELFRRNPEGEVCWYTKELDTISATTIQRAYRRYKHKEVAIQNLSNPAVEQFSFPLDPAPSQPYSIPINKEDAKAWIEAHTNSIKPLAAKFIANVRYISFERFCRQLRQSVKSFDNYLMQLPENERKYAIVIPSSKLVSSNKWVSSLALPFFENRPQDVILSDGLAEFQIAHPEVKRFVLIDDAAYSGKQLSALISRLGGDAETKLHAIVPFSTTKGARRVAYEAWISDHQKMFSIEELCKLGVFNESDKCILEEATGHYDHGDLAGRTLTYFDHKVADELSTFNGQIEWGNLLEWGCPVRFVPEFHSPYKKQ